MTDDQGNYQFEDLPLDYSKVQMLTLTVVASDRVAEQYRYTDHRTFHATFKWLTLEPQRIVSNFRLPARTKNVVIQLNVQPDGPIHIVGCDERFLSGLPEFKIAESECKP